MSSTPQTAQEQRPANLAALRHYLKGLATTTKPASTNKPVVLQGPVLVVRGK